MSRYGQTGRKDIATDARRLRPLLAALGGVDTYKVKVSADDTTPDYLEQKFSSIDTSVEITVKNAGANEVVDFSVATYVADEIATHTGDADAHHNQVHVLATTAGLGADHTVSGLTAGQVLRASGATTAAFAVLQHDDLGGVGADDHHSQSHVLASTSGLGADHTVTGLTAGQVLRATGATTAAFASLQATDLPAHVLATNLALGSQHTISGATAGHVLRATGATTAAIAQLQHSDLGSVGANDHHNQSHVLASTSGLGADHTVSGLTAGQVLRATGAATAAFASIQATDLPTGATLSVSSTNSGNSHAITSSSAVSTATAVLLATDSNGRARVQGFGVGTAASGDGVLNVSSHIFVNDTANAFMTSGITINQGTGDNEILALKSSNVAHGMTDNVETDTFATFSKSGNADNPTTGLGAGGLLIRGYRDATGDPIRALVLAGVLGEAAETGTTLGGSGSSGVVQITAAVKSGTNETSVADDGNAFVIGNYGSTLWIAKGDGRVHQKRGLFINESANTNSALGLTINQGANDDEIVSLKSSDVTHGITDETETDTYGAFSKRSATAGGALLSGWSEADIGFELRGAATSADTTKTSASLAPVAIEARLKSGTGTTTVSANGNLVVLRNRFNTRWIVDAEGDTHRDGSDNTYDTYHDAHLARAFDRAISPGSVIDSEFDGWVQYGREDLIAAGILHESGFYNESRLLRLAVGAVWQEYTERKRLELRVNELEGRLLN